MLRRQPCCRSPSAVPCYYSCCGNNHVAAYRLLCHAATSANVHALQVLAEADLPLLLPDVAPASTPCSALPFGPASAAAPHNTAWGVAPHPPPPDSLASYAPFGCIPPPPFRAAFGAWGPAGGLATGPAGKLLQGGPGHMACISAPAACMQSAAALDAVHYAARHAHMLQDLRGRPVRAPSSSSPSHPLYPGCNA